VLTIDFNRVAGLKQNILSPNRKTLKFQRNVKEH